MAWWAAISLIITFFLFLECGGVAQAGSFPTSQIAAGHLEAPGVVALLLLYSLELLASSLAAFQ
jgi:hypothetical protein